MDKRSIATLLILISIHTSSEQSTLTKQHLYFINPSDMENTVLNQVEETFRTAKNQLISLKYQILVMYGRVPNTLRFLKRKQPEYWDFLSLSNRTQARCNFTKIDAWMQCRDTISRLCRDEYTEQCADRLYNQSALARVFQSDECPQNFTFFQLPFYQQAKYKKMMAAIANKSDYVSNLNSQQSSMDELLEDIEYLTGKVDGLLQKITSSRSIPREQDAGRYVESSPESPRTYHPPQSGTLSADHTFFLNHANQLHRHQPGRKQRRHHVRSQPINLLGADRTASSNTATSIHRHRRYARGHRGHRRPAVPSFPLISSLRSSLLCGDDTDLAVQQCLNFATDRELCNDLFQNSCSIYGRNRNKLRSRLRDRNNNVGEVLLPQMMQTFNKAYAKVSWVDVEIPPRNVKLFQIHSMECFQNCTDLIVQCTMFNSTARQFLHVTPTLDGIPKGVTQVLLTLLRGAK